MSLTDTRIRTLKTGDKVDRLLADGNGLYIRLRVARGGVTRTWQFRRREAGKLSVNALGGHPELSLKEARLKAAELATKRQLHSSTVAEVAQRWLDERVDHTNRKAYQIRGWVDRGILPMFGDRRIRGIEASEITGVVRAYRDEVAKGARARTGGRQAARALLAAFSRACLAMLLRMAGCESARGPAQDRRPTVTPGRSLLTA